MIHPELKRFIQDRVPAFNHEIADGLVYHQSKKGEEWIDSIWKIVAQVFPPGLEYAGYERCSPLDEIQQLARKRSTTPPQLDLARSDFYMVAYRLRYRGEMLPPIYLRLPFFQRGNHITISDSDYLATPVLADSIISVESNKVFIRLIQLKPTVMREPYYYHTNLPSGGETVNVAHSRIWNGDTNTRTADVVQAKTTLAHYVFAKYGCTKAFQLFAGVDVKYGTIETINEQNYPSSDWVICWAANNSGSGYNAKKRFVKPCELRIAIPRAQYEGNNMAKYMTAGLFYVLSYFTYRQHYMEVDDINTWRIMLGILLFGMGRHEGALIDDIDVHILSMDRYIDKVMQAKFEQQGYHIRDMYQLFYLVMSNIDQWIIAQDQKGNCRYGKELNVLYYLYYDITAAIFKFYFELNNVYKKSPDLPQAKIVEVMSTIRSSVVFELKKRHGEVQIADGVSGIATLKATATVTPQADTTKGAPRSRVTLDAQRFVFDASHAEAGHVVGPTKASPDGITRINHCVQLDNVGRIVPNPDWAPLINICRGMMIGEYNQYF